MKMPINQMLELCESIGHVSALDRILQIKTNPRMNEFIAQTMFLYKYDQDATGCV